MTDVTRDTERRLLILASVGKDAALVANILEKHAVDCTACATLEDLSAKLEQGAAAIAVTEESLAHRTVALAAIIARQPSWSDIPVLLLTRPGADSAVVRDALNRLGNVTLLERPVRISAFLSAVRSALRARERQYQTRAHLEEREEASRRKDEFLATLAHELRNPLAPIRNSLHLLRRSDASSPLLQMMDRQVNNIVRLVDDLMEISRVTRGKIDLRKELVDVAKVIGAAVETSRPLIESAGHELILSLPPEPLMVEADPMRLAQVLSNLLNNAAKYTERGGRIGMSAQQADQDIVVSVTDTGIGISADALRNVFEMFSQGEGGVRHSQAGLGIGLTLARSLVELHGGTLSASSEGVGRGSVFTMRLPAATGDVRSDTAPAAASPGIPSLQRVLVVDDNRDAADSLGAVLQVLGADVRVVYEGPAALEAFGTFHPSVVFLDLGMPEMDGFEVARHINQRVDARDTLIVALTGWAQEQDRLRTQAAGFARHLVKPVDMNLLQSVLASAGERAGGQGAK